MDKIQRMKEVRVYVGDGLQTDVDRLLALKASIHSHQSPSGNITPIDYSTEHAAVESKLVEQLGNLVLRQLLSEKRGERELSGTITIAGKKG